MAYVPQGGLVDGETATVLFARHCARCHAHQARRAHLRATLDEVVSAMRHGPHHEGVRGWGPFLPFSRRDRLAIAEYFQSWPRTADGERQGAATQHVAR